MVTLRVVGSTVNLRSEPSSSGGQSTVIAALTAGTLVEHDSPAPGHRDWVKVKTTGGQSGFMKRMLLCQNNPGTLAAAAANLLTAYNDAVWTTTDDFDDVRYKLGAKDPNDGEVDCSGWIRFINQRGFKAVNAAASRTVFPQSLLNTLNTHSDHQVSLPGYQSGQIFSLADVNGIAWRPGLLIGINFANYNWERGQERVFEIDHIVQTMTSPTGELWITQSSSSGGGVNKVRLGHRSIDGAPGDGWLGTTSPQIDANRLHVIDIFRLASPAADADAQGAAEELHDPDLSVAPPG